MVFQGTITRILAIFPPTTLLKMRFFLVCDMNEGVNLDQIFDSFGVPAAEFKEVRLFLKKLCREFGKRNRWMDYVTSTGRIRADAIAEHLPSEDHPSSLRR